MGVPRRITLCTALLVAVVSGLLSTSQSFARPQVAALPKTCVAPRLFRHVDVPALGLKMRYGKLRTALDDPIIAAFDIDETLVRSVPEAEWKALRAKDYQKYQKKFIVMVDSEGGAKLHYEVRPGALSSVIDMHRLGFEVHVFSAGSPKRNAKLLKAIKMPRSNQSLYDFIGGRLSDADDVKFNFDPLSDAPDILKPLDSLVRKSLAHHRPGTRPGDLEYGRHFLAMRENSFLIDNLPKTSPHQIAVPDETIVGADWPQYREYVLGVVAAARDYSMAHPRVPLGTAITQMFKRIPPDYYIVGNNQQFAFSKYFVKRGREEISRHRFTH